jgi:hypothetical protein
MSTSNCRSPAFGTYRIIIDQIEAMEVWPKMGLDILLEEVAEHDVSMMTSRRLQVGFYVLICNIHCSLRNFETPRLEAMAC